MEVWALLAHSRTPSSQPYSPLLQLCISILHSSRSAGSYLYSAHQPSIHVCRYHTAQFLFYPPKSSSYHFLNSTLSCLHLALLRLSNARLYKWWRIKKLRDLSVLHFMSISSFVSWNTIMNIPLIQLQTASSVQH
jgi:hypothetical protein